MNKTPLSKPRRAFLGRIENNKTPDPIFENRILKRIKPRAKRGKFLKRIKPRAKRGENFWGILGTFLILQGKNEAKTKHKFRKIKPRHKFSENNKTPREARRKLWNILGTFLGQKRSKNKAQISQIKPRRKFSEKNKTPFPLFDSQNLKRIRPRFPIFLKGGIYNRLFNENELQND